MTMKCPNCQSDNPDTSRFCSECGTQLIPSDQKPVTRTETIETPTDELTTGTTFAERYQIIEELGKGGMGKVYKAHDTEIKEKIALKLIKPEVSADKNTIERFQNELKLARKISHRNVCRMYDLNKEEDKYYITMEYVHGEDLKRLIRKAGQLSTGRTISIAKQVCEGLAEAHRLGVIHRDLKPQNILVDEEGNVRILDFGIARSLKAKGLTGTGVMIGTPEYMSPEQVEGKDLDHRSDIYSLGIILYEMLTGRTPFEGETPLSIIIKHKSESPRNPRELNAHIPEDLVQVIFKCLEKDREKRYQDAVELLAALDNIEKGIPTSERVMPKRKPLTSREITLQFKLKKVFVPALIFLAVVIVGFLLWRFIFYPKPSEISPTLPLSEKIEEYYTAGKKSLEEKDYSEALSQFRKVLVLEPENIEAQLSLAGILKDQGRVDEAIPEYEKVIELNNLDARPYKHLGELFEEKQDLEQALHYYRKYIETAPQSPDIDTIEYRIHNLETQLTLIGKLSEQEDKVHKQELRAEPEEKDVLKKEEQMVDSKKAKPPDKKQELRAEPAEKREQKPVLKDKQELTQLYIQEGKELYSRGEHESARKKLLEAERFASTKEELAETYFHLALVNYAVKDIKQCQAYLKLLFAIQPDKTIDIKSYPGGFVERFMVTKSQLKKTKSEPLTIKDEPLKAKIQTPIKKEEPKKPILKKQDTVIKEGDLVLLDSVDVEPVVVKTVAPQYHWENVYITTARFTINVLITEKGDVKEATVIGGTQAPSHVKQAVERAVKQWKFKPAIKDGVKVKVWKQIALKVNVKKK